MDVKSFLRIGYSDQHLIFLRQILRAAKRVAESGRIQTNKTRKEILQKALKQLEEASLIVSFNPLSKHLNSWLCPKVKHIGF